MPAPQSASLVVDSRLDQVPVVLRQLMEHVDAMDYGERMRFAIRLAMDEAVTNAIRHGNQEDASKKAHVAWTCAEDRFEATVRDEGPGFDPDEVPDPTDPENLCKPCGRGVMLMRAYMDEVTFNDSGNEVRLKKVDETK